jgi:hypothetical protein
MTSLALQASGSRLLCSLEKTLDTRAPGNPIAHNKLKFVSENECFIQLRGAFWLSALASSHNSFTYSCCKQVVSGAAAEPVLLLDDQIHHN